VTDNAASHAAHHSANDRAASRRPRLVTNDATDSGTRARADDRAALLVAERLTTGENRFAPGRHQHSERNR
jgi:hypothetical protein